MNYIYPPQLPICHIVGASPDMKTKICSSDQDYVIAADGGYQHLIKQNITADLIVGDFDSIIQRPNQDNLIEFPKEKDDTDMGLAVSIGLQKGYQVFYIYGGSGGRFDHSIANIQLLTALADRNQQGYLIDEHFIITAIKNSSLTLPKKQNGFLSVFSHTQEAIGVTLSGLKYKLDNAVITNLRPIGVSNEFIDQPVFIEVKEGILMIYWEID